MLSAMDEPKPRPLSRRILVIAAGFGSAGLIGLARGERIFSLLMLFGVVLIIPIYFLYRFLGGD